MNMGRRHWTFALIVAVLLHLGALWVLLRQPPSPGFAGAGPGPIGFMLGPPGAGSESAAPEPPQAEAEPEPTPEAESVEELAEPEPEPEPIEERVEPEIEPPIEPDVVEPLPDELPVEEEPPLPTVAVEETVPEEVETTFEVTPQPQPRRRPADAIPPPTDPPPAPVVAETPPDETPPPAAQEPAPETAASDAAEVASLGEGNLGGPSGGVPGAEEDYHALISALIREHFEYPSRAVRRGQEGTALVHIVIARDGNLVDYRLLESSGYEVLDRAALDTLERAQPFPAIPNSIAQVPMEVTQPMVFSLR